MRTLKFRVWNKAMNEWYFKELKLPCNAIHEISVLLFSIDMTKDLIFEQFTGLYDKNGEEIYESDIIKHTMACGIEYERKVYWNEQGVFIDLPVMGSNVDLPIYLYTIKDIEIVGNIHENPELIK